MTPVPVGVAGELHIGGTGLTRGYLNRPNLTAERFILDPFGASGERLYRTGDLARYLPDGKIEFVGRKDRQVKLRGYRIELGEIESVLRKHPAVRDVVVHACTVAEADKRLAAYLVPATDSIPSAADLRAWLKQRLPEYMIPSAWVLQSELPRGPHGKLNRDALPPPVWEGSGDAAGELTTDAQRKLAAIWTEVLHVDAIGPGDNFFELGGHSLLATQLVSRIQQSFGVAIPLSEVFDKPSLAALAVTIEAAVNTGDGEIAQLLDELETLSDEEAQKLLYEAQTHS
jgi:acyl carrier protein